MARNDLHELDGRSIVITGASSGIGRAAARLASDAGARVALVGRQYDALAAVAASLPPGRTHVAAVDVRDVAAVEALAQEVLDRFGAIDGWVNGAAVGSVGTFDVLGPELFRAVIETDLLGVAHGCHAALGVFAAQGDRGAIVNIASIVSEVPSPLQAGYSAAKAGVLALTDVLRQELRDRPGISVSAVLPGPVRTPFWTHLANVSGRRVRMLPVPLAPERVASAVLGCLVHPRRRRYVGAEARLLALQYRIAPATVDWLMSRVLPPLLLSSEPATPTAGNITPLPEPAPVRSLGEGGPAAEASPEGVAAIERW